eukprot:ANDGO_02782.mRNA.1 hypothetical protein
MKRTLGFQLHINDPEKVAWILASGTDDLQVHVVGNIWELGMWRPAGSRTFMHRLPSNLSDSLFYTASVQIPANAYSVIEYKFVIFSASDGAITWEDGLPQNRTRVLSGIERSADPDCNKLRQEVWNTAYSPCDPVTDEQGVLNISFNFRR